MSETILAARPLRRVETAAVALDGVRLALGGHVVLRDVTLSIGEGSFVGLLGPNGAGKTTLLRALLGLVKAEDWGWGAPATLLCLVGALLALAAFVAHCLRDRNIALFAGFPLQKLWSGPIAPVPQ